MQPASLVIATRNAHKLAEFRRLLRPARIELEPLREDVRLPPEDGDTYAAIALAKARAAAAATGRAAIGDDSGIEAQALGGAPGVRSARYAGADATDERNLRKLIREAPAGSALRYVCALAYVDPERGAEHVLRGECAGRMSVAPRGARGFGYDPVFLPDQDRRQRTMAELEDHEKDAISHRGNAARALVRWLRHSP
ncbi:MAG: non-canonical purine NTP pyrophosphatase [Solirubrobacteraceae bacterium]